jgi:hypothetical protein
MMVGQVGAMMGGSELGGSAPGGGFAITTEGNSPLATESSSIIVTEAHP